MANTSDTNPFLDKDFDGTAQEELDSLIEDFCEAQFETIFTDNTATEFANLAQKVSGIQDAIYTALQNVISQKFSEYAQERLS